MYKAVDICEFIAHRLRSLDLVREIVQQSGESPHWNSLAEGWPGIACYFCEMERFQPGRRWLEVAKEHLYESIREIKKNKLSDCSLFYGLAGVCFAASLIGDQDEKYEKLGQSLDDLLTQEIERYMLQDIHALFSPSIPVQLSRINIVNGLAGIQGYFSLKKKKNPNLAFLQRRCVQAITECLLSEKIMDGQTVPGWHTWGEEAIKQNYSSGYSNLSHPYGISGCLSSLSLAALEGVEDPLLDRAMRALSTYILSHRNPKGRWPLLATLGTQELNSDVFEAFQDSWASGWPGVVRSLYLAGKALKDEALVTSMEETFVNLLSEMEAAPKVLGSSLSVGWAGLLFASYQMIQSTENYRIHQLTNQFIYRLIQEFDPSSAFGFRSTWDDPGFLNGASGVALVIILLQNRGESPWTQILVAG
jgi:lantibiotic modifying enzyme